MFQVELAYLSTILSLLTAALLSSTPTAVRSVATTLPPHSELHADWNTTFETMSEHDSAAPIADILRLPEALDADRVLEEHSRHFLCIPLLRIFNLELRNPLAAGEHIALTGSHARLGEWNVERSVEMRSLDGGKRLEWLAKVPICAGERIAYRYFIYTLDAQRQRRIRIWEGQQHPRVMESYHIYRSPGVDYFGETASTNIDVGGREGAWLRYDRLIELKFIWQRHFRFQHQQHMPRKFRLKLEVLGDRYQETSVEVARYAYNRSRFRQQPSHGVKYNYDVEGTAGNIVIFRIMEPLRVQRSFRLRLLSLDRTYEFGHVLILNIDLRHSEGILRLPVYSSTTGFDIGRLVLPYLIVHPLPHADLINMRGSFQHYWPLNWPVMHVGNRGAGKSYYDAEAPYVENTIESFLYIHEINGDMVALDVQLTRDYVPVVWHEEGFYTAPAARRVQSLLDLDYILIREMSYRELKRRRVFVFRSPAAGIEEYSQFNVRRRNFQARIFPRLAEVYRQLPKQLGLIVDIKWPQLWQDDIAKTHRRQTALDMNHYVDRLIAITARYGCGRPLIFASFNADICTMLRYKQNVYPIMFLTAGRAKLWQPYKDLRTQSFTSAVNFAQSEFLLGTAPHVANFFEEPRKILLGLEQIQAVFLWGEELQNKKLLRKFHRLHVTGLIYDRMDIYRPHEQRLVFFNAKVLVEVFSRQCASTLLNASATDVIRVGGGTKRRKLITIRIEH